MKGRIEMIKKSEKIEERKSADISKGKAKKVDPRAVVRDIYPGFSYDSTGQLELVNLDTELGKAAEQILISRVNVMTEQEKCEAHEKTLIVEMKKAKVDRFRHKGEYFILRPAKKSEEKLQIKHAE